MVSLAGANKLLETEEATPAKRKAATRVPSAFGSNEEEGSLSKQIYNTPNRLSKPKLLQDFRKKYTTPVESRSLQASFRSPPRQGHPNSAAVSARSTAKRLTSPTKIPSIT